jgi:UDP-N-acetylglucosamine diphosphorylase/glucosamine-1-phosphate N-acetyltransferase
MWQFFFSFTLMSVPIVNSKLQAAFYPFTVTKPFDLLQVGKHSFVERWKLIGTLGKLSVEKIPVHFIPTTKLIHYIQKNKAFPKQLKSYCIPLKNSVDLVKNTAAIIAIDIALAQWKTKQYSALPTNVLHSGSHPVLIEKNVVLKACFMNTDSGAIYISKGVEIQEGVCMRGPLFIGENTIVKMGATIYGGTIIGSNCLIGGEIKNSIIMNHSNKAHHGYLGDSIIGEWCNLGAGTSNSNIKNNVSDVIIHLQKQQINASIKCGLLMGHYSRSAINTSFNTGTVVGISCNIFAEGLTPKSIPSFSWGVQGEKYIFDKAINDIHKWMGLKEGKMKNEELKKLGLVFKNTI